VGLAAIDIALGLRTSRLTEEAFERGGMFWREELGGPASQLGWAREEERGFTGMVQAFDGGAILGSHRGTTYILYADGSWEQY